MNNDWEFDHVGLVVSDLEAMLTYYPSIGIGVSTGPLGAGADRPVPGSLEEEPLPTEMEVYGRPPADRPASTGPAGSTISKVIANLQVGSLVVEVIHGRVERHGMNDDFLRDHGEGISHVCYNLPDPEKDTGELVSKGTGVVMNLTRQGRIVENYLDTARHGSIWFSFRPMPEEWHRAWQAHNRAHPMVNDWRFRGMGVAVRDLDAAADYFQSLGMAEFGSEMVLDSASSDGFRVLDLTGTAVRARTRRAVMGFVTYDFTQTLESETVFGECLSKRGEGAYSLDFTVDDLERESSRLVYRGIRVVLSGKTGDGNAFAYFDTRKVGNMMIQLIQE